MSESAGAQFEEAFDKVKELVQKVKDAHEKIISTVNGVIGWIPGWIAEQVKSAVQKAWDIVTKALEETAQLVTRPGNPWALDITASAWSGQVGATLADLAVSLDPTKMDSHNNWRGRASVAYKESVVSQGEAIKAVKATCDAVASSLGYISNAIVALWVALGVAYASYCAALVVSLIPLAGGVTAPVAAAAIAGSTAAFVALLGAILAGFTAFFNTVTTHQSKLASQLETNPNIPGGKWPKSTTEEISDASVTDGDGSDWHVR